MLIGIFGNEFGYCMGNLKTYTLTQCLYMDYLGGATIYSNYNLFFPHKKITGFKMLLKVLKEVRNASIAIDEMHVYFDAYGGVSKKSGGWFLKEFGRQTRKREVKMYVTAQSFADIHKSIRRIMIKVWITRKLHYDYQECTKEGCRVSHILEITDIKTGIIKHYKVNPKIFDLYNSDEIVEWEEE